MNDAISGFNDWSDTFANWQEASISELHGLMSGLVSVCNAPTAEEWQRLLTELAFTELDEAALVLLANEAEDIAAMLTDVDDCFDYLPLVPDDSHTLYERTMALKDWANGFMTGFGVTDSSLRADENEVLSDLAKIGAIRLSSDEDFNDEEQQTIENEYMQLLEFARMVPVTLSTGRKRKAVAKLALLAGMPLTAAGQPQNGLPATPEVVDAMAVNTTANPS